MADSRLNPYISFDGTAREAMEAYKDTFGGELSVNTFSDFGEAPPGFEDKIMHSQLETPSGFTLMAADTPPGMPFQPGTNIAVSLSGEDEGELRGYWDKLAEGGHVAVALEKQMWGDVFGMVTDRFGVNWMVNIGQPLGSPGAPRRPRRLGGSDGVRDDPDVGLGLLPPVRVALLRLVVGDRAGDDHVVARLPLGGRGDLVL